MTENPTNQQTDDNSENTNNTQDPVDNHEETVDNQENNTESRNTDENGGTAESDEVQNANNEAAKYRRKLRAVEAERDAALTELADLKRQNIMERYSLDDEQLPFLNTDGTLEEFEESAKAYREVHRVGVVSESGTGWGGLGDEAPSWADAIGTR